MTPDLGVKDLSWAAMAFYVLRHLFKQSERSTQALVNNTRALTKLEERLDKK
jgi:hypothetical protein